MSELFLAMCVAITAAALSTSLADGSLKRAAERVGNAVSPRAEAHPPPAAKPSPPPPTIVPPPIREVAPPETSDIPVMRFEDLPVAKQDARAKKAQRSAQRRAGAKRR